METILDSGLIWWITVIELPTLSTLFYLIMKTRSLSDKSGNEIRSLLELRSNQLRESLSNFKLETARTYASINDVKDIELRIINHLLRIEEKLDKTSVKADILEAINHSYKRKD